jgi:hypothetical protein
MVRYLCRKLHVDIIIYNVLLSSFINYYLNEDSSLVQIGYDIDILIIIDIYF